MANQYTEEVMPVTSTVEDRIKASSIFKSSFGHSTVLNIDLSDGVIRGLQTHISGYPGTVVYYRRHVPDQSNMSGDTENSSPSIAISLDRINDFELRFSQTFQFSYMSEENFGSVSGTGATYPGFMPRVGDFFLYVIHDGRMGKFDITSVSRLSISSNTCHAIEFSLVDFMDDEAIAALESNVVDVFFFQMNVSAGSEHAMLRTNERVLLDDIDTCVKRLLDHYVTEFFEGVTYNSFVRPDGVYDPYLVRFFSKYIPFDMLHATPTQLLSQMTGYNRSYWYFLEHPTETYRTGVYGAWTQETYVCSPRATMVTSLLNRPYVQLVATATADAEAYLSAGLGDLADPVDDFDQVVRLYLEQKAFNPTLLLQLAEAYGTLEPIDQFYHIPVLVFLLNSLKVTLQNGIERRVTRTPYAPTRYEFTQANLGDDQILITRLFATTDGRTQMYVLGVLDNTGVQHLFESGEIVYAAESLHVHMAGLMSRLELTSLEGTWTLIFTGPVLPPEE